MKFNCFGITSDLGIVLESNHEAGGSAAAPLRDIITLSTTCICDRGYLQVTNIIGRSVFRPILSFKLHSPTVDG